MLPSLSAILQVFDLLAGKLGREMGDLRVPQPKSKELSVFDPFPNSKNPETGEIGGPTGPEPTRYGDWERKGRTSDF